MNPFTIKVISPEELFCNRNKEKQDLIGYAQSTTNIVLYSPRRYGKTSLIRQVQRHLKEKKRMLTCYVDLFGLFSIDDVAQRIAKSIYAMLSHNKSVLKKAIQIMKTFRPVMRPTDAGFDISIEPTIASLSGMELLEKTMTELGNFISTSPHKINIVLDEFQEITELKAPGIEGCLRKHIQEQGASYFFVGSRRRLLLDMFNQRSRPFYQSAVNYQLDVLPEKEFLLFIKNAFENSGKRCSDEMAADMVKKTFCHPYYTQKLALFVYDVSGDIVQEKDLEESYSLLINTEAIAFESLLLGLTPQQIALLKAIARQPEKSILTNQYMQTHRLKSIGGVQSAVKKLTRLDLIEKDHSQIWRLVDPVFAKWLRQQETTQIASHDQVSNWIIDGL